MNCTLQIIYDLSIFIRGVNNKGSCDLIIFDNTFFNEFVWFISRSNAVYFWILPLLFVFMPRLGLLNRCCPESNNKHNKKQPKKLRVNLSETQASVEYNKDILSDDDSDDSEDFEIAVGKGRKKKDSILGALIDDDNSDNSDGDVEKEKGKYMGNLHFVSNQNKAGVDQ